MYHPTRPVRRARTAAAVFAVAAVLVGAAACGTETADDGQPSAPAQQVRPPFESHPATSADSAERQGQLHLRREWMYSQENGRPILVP